MVAALDDDEHEAAQRERYPKRRAVLLPALQAAGFHRGALRGGPVPVGHPWRAVPRHRQVAGRARDPGGAG